MRQRLLALEDTDRVDPLQDPAQDPGLDPERDLVDRRVRRARRTRSGLAPRPPSREIERLGNLRRERHGDPDELDALEIDSWDRRVPGSTPDVESPNARR